MKTNVKLILGGLVFVAVVVTIILIVIGVSSSSSGSTTTTSGSTTTTSGSTTTTSGSTTTTTGTTTTTTGTTTTTTGTTTTTTGTTTTTPDPNKCENRTIKDAGGTIHKLSTVQAGMKIEPDTDGPYNLCEKSGNTNNYCGDWWVKTGNPNQPYRWKKPSEYASAIKSTFCPVQHCYLDANNEGISQVCFDPTKIPEKDKCENRTWSGYKLATVTGTDDVVPLTNSNIKMCGKNGNTNYYCGNGWRVRGYYDKYAEYGDNPMCPTNSCYIKEGSYKSSGGYTYSQGCFPPTIPLKWPYE